MANVQKLFKDFQEAIKLKRFVDNKVLRDKRDIIQNKIYDKLPTVFEKYKEKVPKYYFVDQGSYKLGTGVKPLDSNLDIDQGLYFELSTSDYPDPVILKLRVFEALNGHTKEVCIRKPCITVYYQQDGEHIFHVDIAVYTDGSQDADGEKRLARGKEFSLPENRIWEESDQEGFEANFENRFTGGAFDQMRHTIRYLKRWKDVNFVNYGNAAPRGIALTVAVLNFFNPAYFDYFSGELDDLTALRNFVRTILTQFNQQVWDGDDNKWYYRLVVKLPVEPNNDLFGRMTNRQIEDLQNKFQILLAALDNAANEIDPVKACTYLQQVFGSDFPVPPASQTAKSLPRAISSHSSSA